MPGAACESREAIVSQGHGACLPTFLAVHETGNADASAVNHVAYWRCTASWARMTHYVMGLNSGVVYHMQPADTVAWMWAMMTHFARALSPRAAPSLAGRVVGAPRWGETVMLDSWYTSADGWIWECLYGGGTTLYVAVGRPTGKPEANDYLAMVGAGGTDCDVDALARAVIRGEYGVGAACRGLEPNDWTGRFVKDLLPVKSEWRRW